MTTERDELIPDSKTDNHTIELRREENPVEAQWGAWQLSLSKPGGGTRFIALTDRDTKTLQTALAVNIGTPGLPSLESVAEAALDAAAEVHWDAMDTGRPYSEVGALAKHNLKSILQPMIFAALRAAGLR